MKQLVIFDLDRTIYNGSLGQDFILHLATKQLISPKIINLFSNYLIYNYNASSKQNLRIKQYNLWINFSI